MRSLAASVTKTFPLPSTATPSGPLNCPCPLPKLPQDVSNMNVLENFSMRSLFPSATNELKLPSTARPLWGVELPGPSPETAKGREEIVRDPREGVGVQEHLDAIVASVRDPRPPARVHGHGTWVVELPAPVANKSSLTPRRTRFELRRAVLHAPAEREEERTRVVEDLDAG